MLFAPENSETMPKVTDLAESDKAVWWTAIFDELEFRPMLVVNSSHVVGVGSKAWITFTLGRDAMMMLYTPILAPISRNTSAPVDFVSSMSRNGCRGSYFAKIAIRSFATSVQLSRSNIVSSLS